MSRFGRNNHSGQRHSGQPSDEANRWYGLGWWKKRRLVQLKAHPLCKLCLDRSIVTPASVADHIEPHNGRWLKFRLGKLQSLCPTCHDSIKRTVEARGYSTEIGVDGWPTDRAHPCYQKTTQSRGNT